MDQHGATDSDPPTPVDDVSTGRPETVRAVDVEKVDVAVHVSVGVSGRLADVPDTLGDARSFEVGGECGVIAVAEPLIGRYLLRAAITAAVRIDRHDRRARGGGTGEDDQRTTPETTDLDDLGVVLQPPGALVEPSGLLIGQPTLDVGDSGEHVWEGSVD